MTELKEEEGQKPEPVPEELLSEFNSLRSRWSDLHYLRNFLDYVKEQNREWHLSPLLRSEVDSLENRITTLGLEACLQQ